MGGGSYHTSALTEQADYYQTNFSDNKGYAEAMYDNSPLNKVTEQGAPGTPWQVIKDANLNSTGTGHTQRIVYGTNITNEACLWTCDETNKRPGTMTGTIYYDVNTLPAQEYTMRTRPAGRMPATGQMNLKTKTRRWY